jgi:uracil-DNA glycosylase
MAAKSPNSPPGPGSSPHSIWRGFLPERAVLMGRRRSAATEIAGQVTRDFAEQVVSETQAADVEAVAAMPSPAGLTSRVVGEGNLQARLLFVGSAPDAEEERQGRPFIGESGALLDKMIEAMGLKREQVYLTHFALPDFATQLTRTPPKVIVALGKEAATLLLQNSRDTEAPRGQFQNYQGARLMPTFHPSELLRSPELKREAWSHLQSVAKELGIQLPAKAGNKKA